MLATAVGQALTKHMHELLDIMLAQGLSEALTQALSDLAHYIPPLLPTMMFPSSLLSCNKTKIRSNIPKNTWIIVVIVSKAFIFSPPHQ